MSLAAEDMADALEAIRDEGAEVTLRSVVSVPTDPNKPWLGGVDTPTDTPVWIAFVDQATAAAMLGEWRKDTEVAASGRFGIMGNHGVEPEIGNIVARAGKEDLVVKDVMVAAPADIPIFYVLEFNA